jgi:hypothetical protein
MATLVLPTGETVLYDDEDADLVEPFDWYAFHVGEKTYAATDVFVDGRPLVVLMHDLIAAPARFTDARTTDGRPLVGAGRLGTGGFGTNRG